MNEAFSETPDSGSLQEVDRVPVAKDYLETLKKNWEHFDTANRIIRIQDAFDIAQSQGMEEEEFCELVSNILDVSLTVAKLFLDSIRPIDQSLIEDAPLPIRKNQELTETIAQAKTLSGVISARKLHKAYRLAKEKGLSKSQFIFRAADVLNSQELVIRTILEDPHFNKSLHKPVAKKAAKPPRAKQQKQPVKKAKKRKPVQRPKTYKSKPLIPKPTKEKDFESLALKNDWDRLNHYEHMAAVRTLINRLKTKYPLSVAIGMLAKKINRSESLISTYYHLSNVRKEILQLLEKELTDTQTAIQIESILDGSKDIDFQKLFATLSELNQTITIEVFRDILQGCFEKSVKDWKNRVTACWIKPDWKGDGEVLNEYELTYIPFNLLSDEEKKRFYFYNPEKEAYVTFQLNGGERYSKVPMEALQPARIKIEG